MEEWTIRIEVAQAYQLDVEMRAYGLWIDRINGLQFHSLPNTQSDAVRFSFESAPEFQSITPQLFVGTDDDIFDQLRILFAEFWVRA